MKYDQHQNITSLWQEFLQNYEWMVSVARPSDTNRFADIKGRLETIAQNYDPKTNKVTRDFPEREIFLTAYEAKRFNQAIAYLRTLNVHHLPIKKIRSMCLGPPYHLEEDPEIFNSEGRDIQFEFILAAFLKRAGFQIEEAFDDIQISYATSLIRYECKRPASLRKIGGKFDIALSQLGSKIAAKENEYGFVALSIERLNDFDQKLYRGGDIGVVFDELIRHKDIIIADLRSKLKISSRNRILGLHLFVSTFLWNKGSGAFMHVTAHFTERLIQEPALPLHDYIFNAIRQKLEEA